MPVKNNDKFKILSSSKREYYAVSQTHQEASPSVRVDRFVRVSAELTGYSVFDLYGTGQAGAYCAWVEERAPEELGDILGRLSELPPGEEARTHAIRVWVMSDAGLGPVARAIIKLWYLGQWESPQDPSDQTILSPSSYREGLVWRAIHAHPQGYKQQGFGAWAQPPQGEEEGRHAVHHS